MRSPPAPSASPRPTVAVVRLDLLPISETFIKSQVEAMARWHPVLVGERRVPGGLALDRAQALLYKPSGSLAARAVYQACRRLHLAYPAALGRMRGLRPALVHVHFGTDAVEFWPYARRLGVPVIVTLHGYDATIHESWWKSGAGGRFRRSYPDRLRRMAMDQDVRFIAVSDFIGRQARSLGIPDEKITTLPIGIDTNAFPADGEPLRQRKRRVLYVGRLVPKKGVEYLLRACARARRDVADIEVAIVGQGPLLPELQELARSLALEVEFLGAMDADQIRAQLKLARAFCLPSVVASNGDAEGFGMVLLEAQSTGLPVITSAIGPDHPGLVHGETGFVTRERDVEELSERIVQLLSDDELATAFSSAASRFVRDRFDIAECTRRLEDLYDAVCSQGATT